MQTIVEGLEQAAEMLRLDEFHEDIWFKNSDFSSFLISTHSFEGCRFESCKFNNMNLERTSFTDCVFDKCELVLIKLTHVRFNGVVFMSGKIMGLNFSDCSDFGFPPEFRDMVIHSAVFFQKNLRKGKFISCRLVDCDFGECDMREADFDRSIFEKVMFSQCNLEKSDFRTAKGYSIEPMFNKIKNARFSLPEAYSFLGFLGIKIED